MRNLVAIGVLVVAAMSMLTPPGSVASTASKYAIDPIDPPVGFTHVYPTHINAAGEIVGTALSENNAVQHAFALASVAHQLTSALWVAQPAAPESVNDAGVVVGASGTGGIDDDVHAVAWDAAGFVFDLGEPGRASGAESVNSHGVDCRIRARSAGQ